MNEAKSFSHPVDLSALPQDGGEEYFEVPEAARSSIAASFEVEAIEDLTARLNLSRLSKNEFLVEGNLKATVLQSCVVTLKPVRTRIDQDVTRRYRVVRPAWRQKSSNVLDLAMDEDDTETVESPVVDLAAPVLEELSLAIDPYPRAEGAAFEEVAPEPEKEESPFAVLKALKRPGEKT